MQQTVNCPKCEGKGFIMKPIGSSPPAFVCDWCNGSGMVKPVLGRNNWVTFEPFVTPVAPGIQQPHTTNESDV